MVFSKIRHKKRVGSCRAFREVNASSDYKGTVGANKNTEKSPCFHDNNTTIHVYAAQWTKHRYILYGDYREEGDGHIDRAFVCSNDH